jgi:Skp family chaperone for outer membrane proteins
MKALTALFTATLLTTAVAQSAQAEESALRPLGSLIEKHQQQDRTLAENGADRSLQPLIQRQQQRLDDQRLAADGAERTLQQWPQRQPIRGTVA